MKAKIEPQGIIEAYENGQSLNAIARAFGTYPTTVRRILERNDIELRHDIDEKGSHNKLKDGEKLIEWAKTQGRLVTRKELAEVIGKTRLSPGYFQKYPELGQYVASYEQKDIQKYTDQLFTWLQENEISYSPNDRSALEGIPVQAKLLEKYDGIVISIDIKSTSISNARYKEMVRRRLKKANEKGLIILFLKEEHFEDLDCIKGLLDSLKYVRER
jgi:hypothetical protein